MTDGDLKLQIRCYVLIYRIVGTGRDLSFCKSYLASSKYLTCAYTFCYTRALVRRPAPARAFEGWHKNAIIEITVYYKIMSLVVRTHFSFELPCEIRNNISSEQREGDNILQ